MYCGESTLVKGDTKARVAVSLRCNSWTCTDCADLRKKRLIAEACGGEPTTFITLTSKRIPGLPPAQAAQALARAWRIVRKRTMRRYGMAKLPFLCVFQATQLGWPHLHIVARTSWIDQKWLSQQMDELIGSPIVDIRKIDNPGRVGGYVSRYIGRGSERFGTCKRYWQSQDYDLRPEPPKKDQPVPGMGWERHRVTIATMCKAWEELGWQIRWESVRVLHCTIPP